MMAHLLTPYKQTELWRQDETLPELWHGPEGLIVNTSALDERGAYFELVRLNVTEPKPQVRCKVAKPEHP